MTFECKSFFHCEREMIFLIVIFELLRVLTQGSRQNTGADNQGCNKAKNY